jgi:hypothetical protein
MRRVEFGAGCTAGRDVIVAMSGSRNRAADSGLPVVDVSPGVDHGKLQYEFVQRNPEMTLKPRVKKGDDSDAGDFRFDNVARLFAEVSAPTVDRTIELARRRRPDVVLHTPVHGTGPPTAVAVGVPAVTQGFNVGARRGDEGAARRVAGGVGCGCPSRRRGLHEMPRPLPRRTWSL